MNYNKWYNRGMKKRTKLILLIIIALALLGIVTTLICVTTSKKNKNTVNVAFYGLEEKDVLILTKNLTQIANEKGEPYTYNFITLDSTKALRPQLTKKTDVVYTYMGANATKAADSVNPKKYAKVGMREDLLKNATVSVRTKSEVNAAGKLSIIPLLMDYYQIDFDRRILMEIGKDVVVSWNDIETVGVRAQKQYPYSILIDSGDSSEFLGLIGALTEALSGKTAYDAAVKELKAVAGKYGTDSENITRNDYEVAVRSLANEKDSPLYEATHLIARWKRSGLISQEGLNMNKNDLLNILNIGQAPVVFQTLSNRRKVIFQHTNSISSIYYPSEKDPVTRFFTVPVIAAVPLTEKECVKQGIEYLVEDKTQGILADDTGLAPVLANCHVPDHQADDVRYWIAATNEPLVPLGEEIFCEKVARDLLADVIISYIKDIQ